MVAVTAAGAAGVDGELGRILTGASGAGFARPASNGPSLWLWAGGAAAAKICGAAAATVCGAGETIWVVAVGACTAARALEIGGSSASVTGGVPVVGAGATVVGVAVVGVAVVGLDCPGTVSGAGAASMFVPVTGCVAKLPPTVSNPGAGRSSAAANVVLDDRIISPPASRVQIASVSSRRSKKGMAKTNMHARGVL